MRFKAEFMGHEVICDAPWNSMAPTFHSPLFPSKRFDKWTTLEEAIKQHDLALRKNFVNHEAYREGRQSEGVAEQVTVTSLSGDLEAWIKTEDGRREKVSRRNLYLERDQVEAAMRLELENEQRTKAAWREVKRWYPIEGGNP